MAKKAAKKSVKKAIKKTKALGATKGVNKAKRKAKRNDGRDLERLVSLFEGHRLPEGFSLEQRRPVRDDDGTQIAELDIVITGKVGSAPFSMLIECRDRPSTGPEPISWIEQLNSRRERLLFNSVIAVSSTGFTKPAADYAKSKGIELRVTSEVTVEDVESRFPRLSPLVFNDVILQSIFVHLRDPNHDGMSPPVQKPFPADTAIRYQTSQESNTALELFHKKVRPNVSFTGIPEDGVPVERIIRFEGADAEGLIAALDGKDYEVDGIDFTVLLKAYWAKMPLAKISQYRSADGSRVIAEHAEWVGNKGDLIEGIQFIGWRKQPEG